MKKKRMKLFAIALAISMIAGTWSVGGENVLARETTTNKTDEEIHDTGTIEDKTQEVDNTEVAFQNLEDNQEQFTGFAGGDGSQQNPYQISTSEMFCEMAEYQGQYFVLIADLDLSDSPRINFEGTFDGNGYTIETGFSEENGMFNKLEETSVVKNCTITIGNGYYSSLPAEHFGAVALQNNGLIKKCIVSGSVINTTAATTWGDISIGSVCSTNYGTIEKCRSDVDYSIRVNIGPRFMISGICNNGKVDQCLNTGNITAQVQRNVPRSGIFHNLLAGVGCLSVTNECANTGNISLDYSSLQTSSSSIYNYAGFISSYEFTSFAFVVPSKMEGINSCYISEDVQFSFRTYNLGSGGGVNSKSTVLYADDVTETQVKTEDEILEWWDSVFADDEDDGGETWIPDGAFSISKSGAWVSGKECALYGSYSAATPGNAEAEAEKIVWSSSDPSILDVSDAIIDFNVADAENNHVSIQKSFTAKKAGTVTVTATTLDGRNSSVTVDIEPELIAVETEKNIRMETEVTLCRMTLDKPDRDFLESVMSKVEIQVSSNPYNTFEIIDKYYDISEDGLSGKFVYVLKPKTDGFASFHITTFGGQEAEITVKSEPYFEWTNQDQWSFLNSPTTDAFGTDTTEGYYISQEDYDRLISSLPNNEKDLITYTEKFADANIQGVNIYNYNIDGLSANAHREWTGSCYGMSVWACLVKAGVINANDIADNIEYINQYLCDPEVESAINYYHFQFELSKVQTEVSDFVTSPEKHIQALKNLSTDFKENGSPAVIWYQWYGTFLADGTGDKVAAHAVAAYDVKEIDPVTINVQDTSYEYNYRVYVYDCTYPEDTHSQEDIIGSTDIFFNDDGVWCIPRHQIVCDTSKWKGDSDFGSGINYNRKNNGYMDYITADTDILNSVDYNTGVYNQGKVMNDFVAIIANTDQKYSISAKDFSASIKGFTVSDVAGEVPIFVSIAPNITTTGEYMPTTGTAFLPRSDFYRIESDDSYMSFSMKSDHYLTNIQSGTSGIINLYSDGSIYALMDESDSCSVRLTANDGYHTLSWYTVQVSGLDMKEISAEWTDDGVLLNGDNLENITVIGTNDDDEQEMTFSTDEDSVLISESDNNLIVLVDIDNDGVYETDVNEKEEHIHEYGTPEFVWFEDYQTCTAIFTCETCDNEQKIECDITSETTDPTCTEDGKTVYTATASFADKEYTDTQEEVISATGHTYEYTDNGDGTHTKVCTAGDDKATEPHTYQDGTCTYCGAEEPKEHVHEYGNPEFKWSEDYTTCKMVFTCKDGDDQQSIECEVTDEITDATCTENGKAVYTAKGTFDGREYTDVKEVEVPASGHTYGTPEFNWSEDYQTCTAVFTCESCDNEQKIECDITSETTDPTCTEDGKTVYTATVSFADKEYTDTQEEVISATGHTYEYTDNGDGTHTKVCTAGDDTATEPHTYQDGICTYCGAEEPEGHTHKYEEPKFTWSDDYSNCTATFTCVDGDDQQIVDCVVTSKDNGDGTISYTAVAEFNGESYTAEQVVDIQDEPDEKPESGEATESGDNNTSGNSTDVNEGLSESKTSEESASNVQTGDDSILALWSFLIASMISAGAIVLLIRKKKI